MLTHANCTGDPAPVKHATAAHATSQTSTNLAALINSYTPETLQTARHLWLPLDELCKCVRDEPHQENSQGAFRVSSVVYGWLTANNQQEAAAASVHQETSHPDKHTGQQLQHYCCMLACRSGNTNQARQQAAPKTLTQFTPCACLAAALCWYNLNPTPHPKMVLPRLPRDRAKSVPTATASVPRHFDSQASRHMHLALPLR